MIKFYIKKKNKNIYIYIYFKPFPHYQKRVFESKDYMLFIRTKTLISLNKVFQIPLLGSHKKTCLFKCIK